MYKLSDQIIVVQTSHLVVGILSAEYSRLFGWIMAYIMSSELTQMQINAQRTLTKIMHITLRVLVQIQKVVNVRVSKPRSYLVSRPLETREQQVYSPRTQDTPVLIAYTIRVLSRLSVLVGTLVHNTHRLVTDAFISPLDPGSALSQERDQTSCQKHVCSRSAGEANGGKPL